MVPLRFVAFTVVLVLGLLFLNFTAIPVHASTIEVSGSITADTTWTSGNIYVVVNHVTVESSATLTIQPGAIIKIHPNKLLGVKGVLKVLGTAASPVIFTSLKDDTGGDTNGDGNATAAAKGDWGHVAFLDTSVDAENLIERAEFRYGGYFLAAGYEYYGCWRCEFFGSIRFDAASPTVRNSKVEESRAYALSASLDSFPVVSGNTLLNNQGNGLEIRGGTLATTTPTVKRWSNTDVVYVLTDHATIDSGVTLAIDANVRVKVAPNKLIGVKGVLKVLGTAASPVIFTSLKDDTVGGDTNGDGTATAAAKGDWGHVAFLDTSVDAENLIERAEFRYGGYFLAAGYEYYGCWRCEFFGSIRFDAASPTVHNSKVEESRAYALSASLDSFPVVSGNTLLNNQGNGLEIRGGTLATTTPTVKRWSNTDVVYVLTDHATIDSGVTLAIDANVRVKVAPNKLIGVKGVLKVLGTAASPVIFTSLKDDTVGGDTNGDGTATAAAKGDWGHIAFFDASVDAENLIERAEFRYGGYFLAAGYEYYGCWRCEFFGSIRFDAASPTVRNSKVEESRAYALSASLDSFPVVSGNTLLNNQGNGLEIRGGTLATTTPTVKRWSNTDVVYVLTDHATIDSGVTLAIDANVRVKVAPNKLIGVKGVLKVLGTAASPVIFTSLKDDTVGGDTNGDGTATAAAKGDWGHIAFLDASVDAENLIDHAEFRYGGYMLSQGYDYYGCWRCEFFGSIRFDAASPTVRNSKVEESRAYALSASLDSFPVVSGNTLLNNQGNGLEIRGGTLATTTPIVKRWNNTDVVYVLTGNATIDSGVTLAIDAGVKVKVTPNTWLSVKGVLKVLGTMASPVTFTSSKDDTVGGDTNGDGTATAAAKGDWGHIAFLDASVDAENLVEYSVVRYSEGSIRFEAASPTVRNSTIAVNRHGLFAKASQPVLGCNNIYDNDNFGLSNETPATVVSATEQWWGHVSGPYHATNVGGSGNLVSDGVNFNPWRTSACGMPPAAPSGLTALGLSTSQITLAWVDNAADESEYWIERAAAGANPAWSEFATVGANVVAFNDGPYTCSSAQMLYRVRAYRSSDQAYSEYSNVAAGASAPCAPANLQATLPSPTSSSLTWQDASPDESEFMIERSGDNGATWTNIATVAGNATTYADAGLQCSSTYLYRTRAYRSGDGIFSDYSNVATVFAPPCAPSGVAASILPSKAVEVVWQDNSDDESEFQIERRVEGDSTWILLSVAPANASFHVDSGILCSTQYYYRVRTYRSADAQASAGYSNEATVRTAPCVPSSLTAQAMSTSEILLSWVDSANDETGFLAEVMLAGGTTWQQSGAIAANSTQFVFASLRCETTYSFRVRAHRNADNLYSFYSDIVSAATADCFKVSLPMIKK